MQLCARLLLIGLLLVTCAFSTAPQSNLALSLQIIRNDGSEFRLPPGNYALNYHAASITTGIFQALEMEFVLDATEADGNPSTLVFNFLLYATEKISFKEDWDSATRNRSFSCKHLPLPVTLTQNDFTGRLDAHGRKMYPPTIYLRKDVKKQNNNVLAGSATLDNFEFTIHSINFDGDKLSMVATFTGETSEKHAKLAKIKYAGSGTITLNRAPISLMFVD
jgi:hypothetical protein